MTNLSYSHGASDVALLGETIGANFDRTAARFPEQPALIACQQGIRWTYRQLADKVDAFAAGLLALGLQPGERIGIWSPNNAEWIVTQFASAKAGLILVNIKIDEDGYCNIVGRIKDMVIRGGENIYPREIEEFLYRHPAIQEVQVFGVPDPRYGEELCAWIKPRPGMALTAEAVQTFCKDQIAHYKVPRYVKFVGEFPMTVTGKMQKFLMREQMAQELGVTAAATA